MSRTNWAFAVFCAALVVAMSGPMGVAGCVNCEGGPAAGFGAPACRGPMFGTEPGCCEHPPSPCDNAWDGFCQEKLRSKQFWSKVGTGYWVQPRARVSACDYSAGVPYPSNRAVEYSERPSCGVYPVSEQDAIRLPPTKDELVPQRGPPPIPEPMDEPDVIPEPSPEPPGQPGQARVPWEFSR